MAIITISRGTLSGGRALASELAERLNYDYVDREELASESASAGVPAALMEATMEKPPVIRHQLHREREQYLAAMGLALCRRAIKGNIVYNGHSGHMLLPGIPNVLRVRVQAGLEYRLHSVQRELGLGRAAAAEYIKLVDAHRDRWVRFLYGVNWHDPLHYDLIIDVDQVGTNVAADTIEALSSEPGYRFTPAVASLINDLHLTSSAQFSLLTDPRSAMSEVKVSARESRVHVICPLHQADRVPNAREVLAGIDGIADFKCSVAGGNILLIQQRFDQSSRGFQALLRMAERKRQAVELMYFAPEHAEDTAPIYLSSEETAHPTPHMTHHEDKGHLPGEDYEQIVTPEGLVACQEELERHGCNGGSSVFFGKPRALLPALRRRSRYDMVVLGDLFVDKQPSVQIRLTAESKTLFAENLSLPVVDSDELQRRFRFGLADAARLALGLLLAAALFWSLFHYDETLLRFAASFNSPAERALLVVAMAAAVVIFAYSYGGFTRKLLKLFGLE